MDSVEPVDLAVQHAKWSYTHIHTPDDNKINTHVHKGNVQKVQDQTCTFYIF